MNSELLPAPALSRHHSAILDFSSETSPLFSPPRLTSALRLDHLDRIPFKVVMAYEDSAAEERAQQKLDELIADSHPGLEPQVIQWPFDFLSDPESLDIATSDATDADLLLFATSSLDLGPCAGEAWLTSCLAARSGRATTLVTIFGADEPYTISIERDGIDIVTDRAGPASGSHHLLAAVHPFAA